MELNQSQIKAINHTTGPMLVLAGPGSGKTLVITRRTKELIETHGVNPENILVITFTKAAAKEMKERFLKITGGSGRGVNFGTFHAVFFTIIKYAYNYNASNIISDEQRIHYLKEIISKYQLEIDDEKEFISGIISEISLVKGERMDISHYYSINCSEDIFKNIYNAYENKLRSENLIDFDDMLVICFELLTQRPDILALWQRKFQYILIDEFQDINKIQYEIIKLLALPENNLFIVGDDDQSIYRFRGAKPEIMLNFSKDYPEGKKILLDINYRSTNQIIKASASLIKNNTKRFDKNIRGNGKEGQEVNLITFKDLKSQNDKVVEGIRYYVAKGVSLSEIAVLFRTNTQPRALIDKLMEYNIPFQMRDVIPNIYEHWIAENVITYMKLAMGSKERALYLQIANRPKRYLSRECFQKSEVEFIDLRKYYSDKDWMLDRIDKLEYDLNILKTMNPYAAINYIRKGIGYEDYLEEYAKFRRIKPEELIDTLNELQDTAREFKNFEEWFHHIEVYKDGIKKQSQSIKQSNKESVSLATMHSSKGLEYRVVFIIDANEGITPHRKAVLDADLEEERRLFYVAMTRAKEFLHIYSVKDRYNKEMEVSRFVGELLTDRDSLTPDTIIEHKSYGEGVIKKNENGKLTIYFKDLDRVRVLDIDYCIKSMLISIKK